MPADSGGEVMPYPNLIPVLAVTFALAGCSSSAAGIRVTPIRYAQGMTDVRSGDSFVQFPAAGRFSICHGHSCRHVTVLALDASQWQRVRSLFVPKPASGTEERRRIASAIALLESMVGEITGTAGDRGENFAGLGRPGQMDCVDESTNSTVYLVMMQNAGLLAYHRVGSRVSRGISRLMGPHFTATIAEIAGGEQYAVDSWFEDNGLPPHVVSLRDWRKGWKPR